MVNNTVMVCKPETRRLIEVECIKEFIRHHPNMEGMKITQNKILLEIAKYYLEHECP